MNQDKQEKQDKPFADRSYREQQDQWLAWQSREWHYQAADLDGKEPPEDSKKTAEQSLPPFAALTPFQAAPTNHKNLDQVLSRHAQARKHLAAFTGVTASFGTRPTPHSSDGSGQ